MEQLPIIFNSTKQISCSLTVSLYTDPLLNNSQSILTVLNKYLVALPPSQQVFSYVGIIYRLPVQRRGYN